MAKNLSKGDERARRKKIMRASKNSDAQLLPQLLARLNSDEPQRNKRHIVRALGNIGGQRSESALLELLDRERGVILGDIAHSLGRLRSRRAVPALKRLMVHKEEWVRQNASFALTQLAKK